MDDNTNPMNGMCASPWPAPTGELGPVERLITLFYRPMLLAEFTQLMEDEHPEAMAAFLLYAEGLARRDVPLKEQFDDSIVGVFDDWERRHWFPDDRCYWYTWLREHAKYMAVPFDDLVFTEESAFLAYLQRLELQLVRTRDSVVVFKKKPDDQ